MFTPTHTHTHMLLTTCHKNATKRCIILALVRLLTSDKRNVHSTQTHILWPPESSWQNSTKRCITLIALVKLLSSKIMFTAPAHTFFDHLLKDGSSWQNATERCIILIALVRLLSSDKHNVYSTRTHSLTAWVILAECYRKMYDLDCISEALKLRQAKCSQHAHTHTHSLAERWVILAYRCIHLINYLSHQDHVPSLPPKAWL